VRFYFHIRRQEHLAADEEGQEFSSITEARMAAIAALCEIAGETLKGLDAVDVDAIEITTVEGRAVGTVTMMEAIRPFLRSVNSGEPGTEPS
jgi:hypothetical protein